MNKKIVLTLILFFSVAALALVFSFGLKAIQIADKISPKEIKIMVLKDKKAKHGKITRSDIIEQNQEVFEEIDGLNLYSEIDGVVEPAKKNDTVFVFYKLIPQNADYTHEIKVVIRFDKKNEVTIDKDSPYADNEYFSISLEENHIKQKKKENIIYLKITLKKDVPVDNYSISPSIIIASKELENVKKSLVITTNQQIDS